MFLASPVSEAHRLRLGRAEMQTTRERVLAGHTGPVFSVARQPCRSRAHRVDSSSRSDAAPHTLCAALTQI